jgi:catechol 2,3-dioxygenase-like lactoylglutathione lyase family enzyme
LPGCGDFCFVWDGEIQEAIDFVAGKGIHLEFGPVERTGARAQSLDLGDSIYFRDPDQNLLEFIAYRHAS